MRSSKTNGFAAPYSIAAHIEAQSGAHPAHSESTPGAHLCDRTGKHTAKDLADSLGIGGSTLRTRWHRWLAQAVGESRLKVGGKYTNLAKHLFERYKAEVAEVEGASGDKWAAAVALEYPPVIEAELEPEPEAPGALQTQSSALALRGDAELGRRVDELDQLDEAIALAKQMLQGDISEIKERAAEREALDQQRQQALDELRALQIERDELLRIEEERQRQEQEAEIRRRVRERVLGKPSGQL